ncbi:MAG TPA: N-acetylneuraminate synthase family protein [Candidatus Nanoarchaeia archaeon]|nr:N-acetylneuraminate synthase family protein [Candidatus Nanoarchaeia archaeon]
MANTLTLGSKRIGAGQPCFLLADIGPNHQGDLNNCRRLIDLAAEHGWDAVAVEFFHPEQLVFKSVLKNSFPSEVQLKYSAQVMKRFSLDADAAASIKQHCAAKKIALLAYANDAKEVAALSRIVDGFVMLPNDAEDAGILDAITKAKKPALIQSGFLSFDRIKELVAALRKKKVQYCLMHSGKSFPAEFDTLNLSMIRKLKALDIPVGYYSYELGIAVASSAVLLGADIVAKHITLSRDLEGAYHGNSLEENGMKLVSRDLRKLEQALGKE